MKRFQAQLGPLDWKVIDLLNDRVIWAGMNIGDAHRLADVSNQDDYTPESWFRCIT